jgi:hypothetical protein
VTGNHRCGISDRDSGHAGFRYVLASEIACLPDRSHRCKYPCRAAKAFTSEQNVRRYLRTHRICYPPHYRQLAERGLAAREILSFVLDSDLGAAPHCME